MKYKTKFGGSFMKKILALASFMIFAINTFAEVRDFTESKIKVEVPEGWTTNETHRVNKRTGVKRDTIDLISPFKVSGVNIMRSHTVIDDPLEKMMEATKNLKVGDISNVKKESDSSFSYDSNMTGEKVHIVVTIKVMDDETLITTVSGYHADQKKIVDSIELY